MKQFGWIKIKSGPVFVAPPQEYATEEEFTEFINDLVYNEHWGVLYAMAHVLGGFLSSRYLLEDGYKALLLKTPFCLYITGIYDETFVGEVAKKFRSIFYDKHTRRVCYYTYAPTRDSEGALNLPPIFGYPANFHEDGGGNVLRAITRRWSADSECFTSTVLSSQDWLECYDKCMSSQYLKVLFLKNVTLPITWTSDEIDFVYNINKHNRLAYPILPKIPLLKGFLKKIDTGRIVRRLLLQKIFPNEFVRLNAERSLIYIQALEYLLNSGFNMNISLIEPMSQYILKFYDSLNGVLPNVSVRRTKLIKLINKFTDLLRRDPILSSQYVCKEGRKYFYVTTAWVDKFVEFCWEEGNIKYKGSNDLFLDFITTGIVSRSSELIAKHGYETVFRAGKERYYGYKLNKVIDLSSLVDED